MRTHRRALFDTEALPHLPALYNFALALAGASDAEDLVQTTCVRALEKVDSYRPGTNMRAWLFTILRNEWVSRHRRAQRWTRWEAHADEKEAVELADEAAELEGAHGPGSVMQKSKSLLISMMGAVVLHLTQLKKIALLRDMINWCIENPLEGPKLADGDDKMKALEVYILSTRKGVQLDPGKH